MKSKKTINLGLFNQSPTHKGGITNRSHEDIELEISFHLKHAGGSPQENEELNKLLDKHPSERKYISFNAFKKEYSSDSSIITDLVGLAKDNDLKVIESSSSDRVVSIKASLEKLRQTFGINFMSCKDEESDLEYVLADGNIELPEHIADHISSITGPNDMLAKAKRDNKELKSNESATPEGQVASQSGSNFLGYTPEQIEQAYNFPKGTGKGQTIGLVELGGSFKQSDLEMHLKKFGITPPTIKIVGEEPTESAMDDYEVTLDVELCSSLVPEANFVIYYGKSLIDAIKLALSDTKNKPGILSISWAGSELNYSVQELNEMNELLHQASLMGITVVVASGDQGAYNEKQFLNVNVPASDTFALGCGGTSLYYEKYEAVWNELQFKLGATGGGFSQKFAIPYYQRNEVLHYNETSVTPGYNSEVRAVPDISANADSKTGYQVVLDGHTFAGGGTSAATPVWAALIARLNENLGYNLGFINPLLYRLSETGALNPVFMDGQNNGIGNNGYYLAENAWNPCTGLGTPNGIKILEGIKSLA